MIRQTRLAMAVAMPLVLGLAGCAKSSAESAVASAEKAIAGIQEDASKIAPNQLQALTDSLTEIKAKFTAGDYQSALMSARSLTSMTRDLGAQLPTQRDQLNSAFNNAAAELPKMIDAVVAKVGELGKARRLPPGIDPAKFAALQGEVGGWSGGLAAASEAFKRGELAAAMSQANTIRSKVHDAMALLKM